MMRTQLTTLHERLRDAVKMIDPTVVELKEQAKLDAFATALKSLKEEHKNVLSRKAIITRRKEIIGTLLIRKEKEEAREKALRQQQEQEAEKLRIAEELKKRELDRLRRERDAIKKEEAKKLAQDLEKKTGVALNIESYENVDARTIMAMQVEQLEQEKRETQTRLSQLAKRIDHIERAYRIEEIPLLDQDYEEQQKQDKEAHERACKLAKEEALLKHIERVEIKKRVGRMLSDFVKYRQSVLDSRKAAYEARKQEAEIRIEEEKQTLREQFIQKRDELAKKKAEEEAKRQAQEEQEAREAEGLLICNVLPHYTYFSQRNVEKRRKCAVFWSKAERMMKRPSESSMNRRLVNASANVWQKRRLQPGHPGHPLKVLENTFLHPDEIQAQSLPPQVGEELDKTESSHLGELQLPVPLHQLEHSPETVHLLVRELKLGELPPLTALRLLLLLPPMLLLLLHRINGKMSRKSLLGEIAFPLLHPLDLPGESRFLVDRNKRSLRFIALQWSLTSFLHDETKS
jgi:hypothetical protein